MLDIRDLSVSYGQHRALENASLSVRQGEIVAILGANGAGKTTLLNAVCGISEGRATGSVVMDGQELLGEKPHRIVEAAITLVPQGRGIFADLTVEENLLLGAYTERARDEEAGNLERVLALFPKLGERRRQTVRTMSGGEQQMVAIGRAMMSNPQILALDEPSLGLSPLLCTDLFRSLRAVRASGIGILLVEQNAKQSLAIANRGYLLENGKIVHEDDADALASNPAVQEAYLGGSGASKAPGFGPAAPRRRSGGEFTPNEIAAAALKGVSPPASLRRPEPGAKPKALRAAQPQHSRSGGPDIPASPRSSIPDTDALVARARAISSPRRPSGPHSNGPAPSSAHTPPLPPEAAGLDPKTGNSADRLRTVLEEIEAAARRAERHRPRDTRR